MKITDEKTLEMIDKIFAKLRKELKAELQKEPVPPPAMSVGDSVIIDGFKANIIGDNYKPLREGEWWYDTQNEYWSTLDANQRNAFSTSYFKAIITDPKYWTGTLMDEKVRCYENKNGNIEIYFTDRSRLSIVKSDYFKHLLICEYKLWLSAIKSAGIPIMPHWMIDLQGGMKPPESEE